MIYGKIYEYFASDQEISLKIILRDGFYSGSETTSSPL